MSVSIGLIDLNPNLHLTLDLGKSRQFYWDFLHHLFVEKVLTTTLLKAGHSKRSNVLVEVLLISDNKMEYYTSTYGPEPGPTNVLSFPLLSFGEILTFPIELPLPLGSILLGFPYIVQEIHRNKFLPEAHVARLLIHGMLHLLGHDHVELQERTVMESLESSICTHLGYNWSPL